MVCAFIGIHTLCYGILFEEPNPYAGNRPSDFIGLGDKARSEERRNGVSPPDPRAVLRRATSAAPQRGKSERTSANSEWTARNCGWCRCAHRMRAVDQNSWPCSYHVRFWIPPASTSLAPRAGSDSAPAPAKWRVWLRAAAGSRPSPSKFKCRAYPQGRQIQ